MKAKKQKSSKMNKWKWKCVVKREDTVKKGSLDHGSNDAGNDSDASGEWDYNAKEDEPNHEEA